MLGWSRERQDAGDQDGKLSLLELTEGRRCWTRDANEEEEAGQAEGEERRRQRGFSSLCLMPAIGRHSSWPCCRYTTSRIASCAEIAEGERYAAR